MKTCPCERLYDALKWLVHIGHGVGKAGYSPEPGEFKAAIEAGEQALDAYQATERSEE